MQEFPLIIAAGIGDVLSALVPVVVFIIWVIGQIANRTQAPAKPVRGPERRPADLVGDEDDEDEFIAAPRPAAPQANAGGKKNVFDEIEQFLARARQQAQQAQQGNNPQQPRPAQPANVPPRPAMTVQTVVVRPSMSEPVMAEVIEPRRSLSGDVATQSGQLAGRHQVSTHVSDYLSTAEMNAQVDRLGDAVEIADDVMEAHLKQVFDHRVGTLSQDSAQTTPVAVGIDSQKKPVRRAAPIGVAALLANTGSIRQAILANEILQRPSDRW
jgi:hypothetical protein